MRKRAFQITDGTIRLQRGVIMAKFTTSGVRVRLDVGSVMPDGVRLSNDIYLPPSGESFPCLLIRTPYSNNDPLKKVPLARYFAANGYAVIMQDVRGRYDSDGEWEPFFAEAADGVATQGWIASQPFCNGRIAQMGRSYEGYSAWMSAFGHHPALKAIVPIVALPDPVLNVPLMNGSPFWNMITWAMFVHGRTNQYVEQFDWESLYTARPLNRLDEMLGFESKAWRDWMAHPLKDDYWKRACYMHRMTELDIPALHICGWYDDDGASTYNNFPNARRISKARDGQYLLVGPWPHATNTKCIIHGVDFGPQEIIDLNGYILRFLNKALGINPEDNLPRARIFIMGENKWHDLPDWPTADTRDAILFVSAQKGANSLFGDGKLRLENDAYARFDSYNYDPDNPTPYLYDAGTLQVGGPFDARPVQRRDDVLCFSTPPLAEDVVICGRVFSELFVSSSAEDTEFVAKLCVVFENGEARQLCDGNIRLALRNSLEKLDPVPAGNIVKVRIDMWATAIRVFAGQRIRLEIASAACPKFAAHTNTLESPGEAVRAVIAENCVYSGGQWPSKLLLPIMEGSLTFVE